MKKRLLAMVLAVTLVCVLAVPAAAYDMGKAGKYNIISAGNGHTAAIDENGSLWTWGSNGIGQLGNGGVGNESVTVGDIECPIQTIPVQVLDNVATVSCGGQHTAIIKTDGTLWMWGDNRFGELGNSGGRNTTNGNGNPIQTVPVQVMDHVAAVSCGYLSTAAIKTDGTLWMWGWNAYGQLGNGGIGNEKDVDGFPYQTVPVKVLDNVAAVSCGIFHTAAIKTDGTLWMWGWNGSGGLGNGTTENSNIPVQVMDNVAAVSCGNENTATIKTDGTLWMWGLNQFGQLGNGGVGNEKDSLDNPLQTVPVQVMDHVAAVNCGEWFTAAIKTDGSLWTWGNNDYGQLGNGYTWNAEQEISIYQTVPVKVLDDAVAVSCGEYHITGVKADGTLWTWGFNDAGQLGNGGVGDNSVMITDRGENPIQTVPAQIALGGGALKVKFSQSTAPAPVTGTAYPSTQAVEVDGKAIEFQCYALKDENGNDTNYIKLRDLADILNGSAAQFQVGWDGNITITTKTAYTKNGTEQSTPFNGERAYEKTAVKTLVDGKETELDTFQLKDDNGGGYTYYKLRDLGKALGITVDWTADRGIYIETK